MNQSDITIGIITTDNGYERNVKEVIQSINDNVPQAKIIVVGGTNSYTEYPQLRHIQFDEEQKEKWITRKKNIIANECETKVLVLCHDYILFTFDWYDKWNEFGWDWDFSVNPVYTKDGKRHFDLNSNDHPLVPHANPLPLELCTEENFKYCYISGAYFLVKTDFILKFPLNEELAWGQCEDVHWCNMAKQNGKMKFNLNVKTYYNISK
jgi:hypothetical protein